MRPLLWCHHIVRVLSFCICLTVLRQGHVVAAEPNLITGLVQKQDLRRVGQVIVEVKNQEGTVVATGVSNDAGEFRIPVLADGTYSVSALQDTYRSEYIVLKIEAEAPSPAPVTLTLSTTREIAL